MYWLRYLSQVILRLLANDSPYPSTTYISHFTYPYTEGGTVKMIWTVENVEMFGNRNEKVRRRYEIAITQVSNVMVIGMDEDNGGK